MSHTSASDPFAFGASVRASCITTAASRSRSQSKSPRCGERFSGKRAFSGPTSAATWVVGLEWLGCGVVG